MPQSVEDIVRFASERATASGMKPISRSVFEDWVFEDFIPSAEAQSRRNGSSELEWRYPDRILSIVSTIIDLKSLGARRHSQLRIYLWLHGLQVDFSRLQQSLRDEHFRSVRSFERYASIFSTDPYNKMSERKRQRFKARIAKLTAARLAIGEPDRLFAGMTDILSKLPATEERERSVSILMSEVVADYVKRLLPANSVVREMPNISFDVSGIFDEELTTRSSSPLLDDISIQEMDIARARLSTLIQALKSVGEKPDLGEALGVQIDTDAYAQAAQRLLRADFIIPAFIMFAVDAHRSGKRHNKIA
jgi:hypothetical protein